MERQWLVVASEANFSHVNQMLLRNSSLVNKKDFINGYTALHWAIKLDKFDTVRLLLESNADPSLKTHVSTLLILSKLCLIECALWLDPFIKGGQTALHLAAKFGRSDVISLLVDNHGVDVYARDHAGKQPRDIASAKVKEECKVMLDWKDVDSSPPEIEVPLKTSGSFTSDVQDGSWKPSRSRNFFSPGILKRSFRRLRGKTPKEKPVITHVYPQPSSWTDEPERGNGEYKLSTSEGDLTAID
ncbi:ankyrin repeat domain-containing protein SOWAHC-like [Oscarella lobularis]|uniref:ankyrin repeat domain-containing protein SOWAHC-like n=1 Tax=Oscarella lobularis TaxID=121494 RepID=UPI0033135854